MIRRLDGESAELNQTQLFIEAPYRNNRLLQRLLEVCKPSTKICLARDVSGKDEMIKTMTTKEWKTQKIDLHKRPTVFLLYAGN